MGFLPDEVSDNEDCKRGALYEVYCRLASLACCAPIDSKLWNNHVKCRIPRPQGVTRWSSMSTRWTANLRLTNTHWSTGKMDAAAPSRSLTRLRGQA